MIEEEQDLSLRENTVKDDLDNSEIAATESSIPKEIDDALNSIPDKEQARVARSIMSMQFGAISATPENAISKKITSEHITQYLTDSSIAMKECFKERRDDKIFKGFALLVTLIFVVILIVLLKDKPSILEKIIYTIGGLVAGCVGGYGYGYKKGMDE